jgi:hypothetical protein
MYYCEKLRVKFTDKVICRIRKERNEVLCQDCNGEPENVSDVTPAIPKERDMVEPQTFENGREAIMFVLRKNPGKHEPKWIYNEVNRYYTVSYAQICNLLGKYSNIHWNKVGRGLYEAYSESYYETQSIYQSVDPVKVTETLFKDRKVVPKHLNIEKPEEDPMDEVLRLYEDMVAIRSKLKNRISQLPQRYKNFCKIVYEHDLSK